MAALDGIKVLDISEVMQAPLAAQVLGDFGAEVIKIERPAPGEIMRNLDRHGANNGLMSCYFAAMNRNKRAICLDFKKPEAREAVRRMVRQVDVLIHNYRPGAMERLGLSYEELALINPRLIYAVAYAFGETGPLSHKGGQDLLAQSYSGLAMNGVEPGAPPRLSESPAVDFGAGMTLAQGILLALFERERSGQGQKVTISLLDTAVAMQALEVSTRQMYGYETNFLRNADVYQSRDGWVTVLSFFRDNPLRLLSAAFEMEDLSLRPEFATIDLQVENKGQIHEIMEGHFKQRTTAECVALLEATDILCGPILSLEETLAHPQLAHNETLVEVAIANQDSVELAGNPVRLSRTPMRVEGQVGEHGRDTVAVLRDYGFEAEEIDALAEIGAFGGA